MYDTNILYFFNNYTTNSKNEILIQTHYYQKSLLREGKCVLRKVFLNMAQMKV